MKDSEFFYQEGLRFNLLNRNSEAVEYYTKSIEINPSHLDAILKRGTVYYKLLKRYEDALKDFNLAVETAPECAAAYLHRGIVKCHLLNFKEAMTDFDRAIQLDPNDERAFYNRGKDKYVLKYCQEEVCNDLDRAVKLGSAQAAELKEMFYGKNQDSIKDAIKQGIKRKAEVIKNQNGHPGSKK
jgi:tetratricopeptide (TPR) repeat protein